VRAAGYAPKEIGVSIEALGGSRPVVLPRIELEAAGNVEGTVVDGRGDPVQGARVAKDHVPVYLATGAPPSGVAMSDARGHFQLSELAEGTCVLEIYAPDLGRSRVEGVRVTSGRTTDVGKIALRKDDGTTSDPGSRGGVAVTLGETADHEVVLVAVAEGSEAERTGLAPGDVIVDIDGEPIHAMDRARAKLSGPVGHDLILTLRRSDKTLALRVSREEVRR
jgi:S1-C subfamily serine protease